MRISIEDVLGSVGRKWTGRLPSNIAVDGQPKQDAMVPAQKKHTKVKKQIQRDKEYLTFVRRPGETEIEFQKRKNACYVRRNYHRNRIENMAMRSEAKEGEIRNKALKTENKRLQDLLVQARSIIQSLEDGKTGEAMSCAATKAECKTVRVAANAEAKQAPSM